jgi:hypothetical protein
MFSTQQVSVGAAIVALIGAGATILAAVIPAQYGAQGKGRELDIKLVEIGMAILRSDPKEIPNNRGTREWAVEIVEKYSGVKFSARARNELIENRLHFDFTFPPPEERSKQ